MVRANAARLSRTKHVTPCAELPLTRKCRPSALASLPEQGWLASGGSDGSVRLWRCALRRVGGGRTPAAAAAAAAARAATPTGIGPPAPALRPATPSTDRLLLALNDQVSTSVALPARLCAACGASNRTSSAVTCLSCGELLDSGCGRGGTPRPTKPRARTAATGHHHVDARAASTVARGHGDACHGALPAAHSMPSNLGASAREGGGGHAKACAECGWRNTGTNVTCAACGELLGGHD
jgi:hypothetical protein